MWHAPFINAAGVPVKGSVKAFFAPIPTDFFKDVFHVQLSLNDHIHHILVSAMPQLRRRYNAFRAQNRTDRTSHQKFWSHV